MLLGSAGDIPTNKGPPNLGLDVAIRGRLCHFQVSCCCRLSCTEVALRVCARCVYVGFVIGRLLISPNIRSPKAWLVITPQEGGKGGGEVHTSLQTLRFAAPVSGQMSRKHPTITRQVFPEHCLTHVQESAANLGHHLPFWVKFAQIRINSDQL